MRRCAAIIGPKWFTQRRTVRDRDAALREQILNVTKAQREPEIEPNRLMYHLGREPISGVADFPHASATAPTYIQQAAAGVTKPTIVALRGDNASPHTMENARRKAYTALSLRTSTTAYAKRLADGDLVVRQQVTLPNVIAIPGGLPIKVGDDFIGGVGVSGSPGVDDPCVQAGLDKVADQLN